MMDPEDVIVMLGAVTFKKRPKTVTVALIVSGVV
jgi:hypothetical protein